MSRKPSIFDDVKLPEVKEPPQKKEFLLLKNLKFLPKLLSDIEKKIIVCLLLVSLIALAFLGVKNSRYQVQNIAVAGGEYREAVVGQPQYLNPLLSENREVDQDICALVYNGLMRYNEKNELLPDLAESYEVSADQKNYTFHLKKNIKWHDGEKFTAEDVVFTVQMIKNPQVKSPLYASFSSVAVEKLDDFTVKFTLTKDAYAPFLKENTTFGILPEHVWENVPPGNINLTELNLKPIGTGPFKFKEFKKDRKTGSILSFTLENYHDYHGARPLLKYFTFSFYMDWDSALEAYKKGDTSGISFIPEESKALIDEKFQKKINSYHLKLPRYYALFFNFENNPYLKERNVRRAIAYALNREKIINEALQDEATPVYGPILPQFLGYNEGLERHNHSLEKAREELEKASWKVKAEDNLRYKDGKKLEFVITTTDEPSMVKTAEIIKNELAQIGIAVQTEAIDAVTLQTENIKPRNYEALIYSQLVLHDPDPYLFWHSTERKDPGFNLSSLKNSTIDDLLETARKTNNDEERIKKYTHFQNLMAEELPAIFLYSPTYAYSLAKKVQGFSLEYITLPKDRFVTIDKWYLKTKPILVKK